MLKGCDISHFQKVGSIDFSEYDFVIIKATEGNAYIDPALDGHYNSIAKTKSGKPTTKKLYGFYHYARPELKNHTAETEAKHFVNTVGHHSGHALFVLDWEQKALNYPVSWALEWLNIVYKMTGVKPLIYCSASYTKKLKPILDAGYGLWVAHYTKIRKKPTTGVYKVWALWQYTSKPLDLDYFNGSIEQFRKYCSKV